jgi:phospholipase C
VYISWHAIQRCLAYPAMLLMLNAAAGPLPNGDDKSGDRKTATPIRHVIVIIGENRSFDNLFATYVPKPGQKVWNLYSEGIVNLDGTPGPNFGAAAQMQAQDTGSFQLSPAGKTPYATLPAPNTGGAPEYASDSNPPPFATLGAAAAAEPALLPADLGMLLTGATGQPKGAVDTRIANYAALANGPFPLTPSVAYDAYVNSPVHRFYQMWQQSDCNISQATPANPSGCRNDLYPWVEVTVGAGSNGKTQPANFTDESTHEGATAMGFYNMSQGDAAFTKQLADEFTISDNYHQAIMGGTGANHVAIGTADAIWYSDGHGNVAVPPANEIENPNPQPGTNNWYTQDGYSGGSYSNCSDPSQPGAGPILSYLSSLPYHPSPRCAPGAYYLLNNYNPGYFGDGTVDTTDTYTIPPSTVRTIGDELLENNISWKYYGEGWNLYVNDPEYQNPLNRYCNICNPFAYVTSIMTNAAVRTAHLADVTGQNGLFEDLAQGTLPAVSFVKPDGFLDGHPASSKWDLFEGFVQDVLSRLNANRDLAAHTAVIITTDEAGGYYDSGYIQPLDFFGDGPRIPLIVVSPYSRGGRVVHTYTDHASIAKFIERNWNLGPISNRSRDNFPNPAPSAASPYVPSNSPAIGDLMDMFNFGHGEEGDE